MNPSELSQLISGDGESAESAVKFAPSNVRDRVNAEREFICAQFGTENVHWTEEMHYTSLRFQSVWEIILDDETQRSVHFETEGTIYDEN